MSNHHVVIVEKNKDGKIELTKDELQKMLDDAYNQGYWDGKPWRYDTITYPHNSPWYTTTSVTLSAKDVTTGSTDCCTVKGTSE